LLSRRDLPSRLRRRGPAAAPRPHSHPITTDQRRHRTILRHPHIRAPLSGARRRRRRPRHGNRPYRQIYNTIRPHQALDDGTPRSAYLDVEP
jgi:hypothetical protein